MRNDIDIAYFEKKLKEEEARLQAELATLGRKNPDNPADWEAVGGEEEGNLTDPADLADNIGEYENKTAVLKQLETELSEVGSALARIAAGTYGVCEKSGHDIEKERLEANPAARTCIQHLND